MYVASKVIQFPVRYAGTQPRSHDSLALDTDHSRVTQQIEQEIAQKAQRMATGMRTRFAQARSQSNLLAMPAGLRRSHRIASRLRVAMRSLQAWGRFFVSRQT